jgi:phytoene synthase
MFPKLVRDDVGKLYGFLAHVHGLTLVDPVDVQGFDHLESRWQAIKTELAARHVPAALDASATEQTLAHIAYVTHRYGFDPAWVDAFLQSMRYDLQKHQYRSLKDLQVYMYGSAEVIGLMLARMVGLPEESQKAARMQARAVQYILFLRHLAADTAAGRNYFPANDVKKFGLKNLSKTEAEAKPGMFADFMHAEILRYAQWQAEANENFLLLPRRLRIPLQTLVDSYNWTANQLKNNPMMVYESSLKPRRRRVFTHIVKHTMTRH